MGANGLNSSQAVVNHEAAVPVTTALYMAVVQFLFVTTWTIYVIFLPKLLQSAGLPATLAPLILLVDQLVFMAMDVSVNTATQFLRFTRPDGLEWLMPVFWIGFAVAMVPGSALCGRYGTLRVMAVSAALGALGALASASANALGVLIVAQLVAGGAWGSMLMCAFTAATAAGRTGREGLTLGMMFAVLAAATLGRIATVMSGAPKQPDLAAIFSWLPGVCWLAGALLISALAVGKRSPVAAAT